MKIAHFISVIVLAFATVGLSACAGDSGGGGGNVDTQSLSYDFTYNKCNTGKHTFNSNADMCAGLKDESLNNGCARSMRQSYFEKNCPGQTFSIVSQSFYQSIYTSQDSGQE